MVIGRSSYFRVLVVLGMRGKESVSRYLFRKTERLRKITVIASRKTAAGRFVRRGKQLQGLQQN